MERKCRAKCRQILIHFLGLAIEFTEDYSSMILEVKQKSIKREGLEISTPK